MNKPRKQAQREVDAPADDPTATMKRFNWGLKRVLTAPRVKAKKAKKKR
jgi:hypothetical protein